MSNFQPVHIGELRTFITLEKGSILDTINEVCETFRKKYGFNPNMVFVNAALLRQFDKEVATVRRKPLLCVHYDDIVWFHCPTWHANALPDAQWIVVTHTQLGKGDACSL